MPSSLLCETMTLDRYRYDIVSTPACTLIKTDHPEELQGRETELSCARDSASQALHSSFDRDAFDEIFCISLQREPT